MDPTDPVGLILKLILVNVRGAGPRIKDSRRSALGVSPARAAVLLQRPRARDLRRWAPGVSHTKAEGPLQTPSAEHWSRLQDSSSSELIDPNDASDPT